MHKVELHLDQSLRTPLPKRVGILLLVLLILTLSLLMAVWTGLVTALLGTASLVLGSLLGFILGLNFAPSPTNRTSS